MFFDKCFPKEIENAREASTQIGDEMVKLSLEYLKEAIK